MKRTFAADNTLAAILVVIRDASTYVKEHGASARSLFITDLVLEEVLTNIVKYGYSDTGRHLIEVVVEISEDRVVLEFHDDGRPFDPLKAPPPKLGQPVKTQRLGGRGIYLLKKFVEDMSYRRESGRNILTFGYSAQAG